MRKATATAKRTRDYAAKWVPIESVTPSPENDQIYGPIQHDQTMSEPERPLPLPPPPGFEAYAALGTQFGDDAMNTPPHDGFTVGEVEYIDHERIDVHQGLTEWLSNTKPMFRKVNKYVDELEYRAILRPGSPTGEEAWKAGKKGIFVPVRLDQLIDNITFVPIDDPELGEELRQLASKAGLNVPIGPSSLGLRRSDLPG